MKSELEMIFESDGQTLKFNGVPFYPVTNPTLPPTLFVSQKRIDDQDTQLKGYEGNLRLSYSLEYEEKKFEEHTLITVMMTIMGLDGQMIRVDNVEIKAVKALDGSVSASTPVGLPSGSEANITQLILHSITAILASPDAPDAKCENILCRVFAKLIAGAVKAKTSAKGAVHRIKCFCVNCIHRITGHKVHKHEGDKAGLPKFPYRKPDGTFELPTHIKFKPGHHGHHHHHRMGFFGKTAMLARTAFKVVFVPILIGVAFGMAASAIGMLAGQFVVFLWMKFRKTSTEASYTPLDTDEKEEAPPAYQDLPTKVEAVSEKEIEATA